MQDARRKIWDVGFGMWDVGFGMWDLGLGMLGAGYAEVVLF
jgi:hypothetical protein